MCHKRGSISIRCSIAPTPIAVVLGTSRTTLRPGCPRLRPELQGDQFAINVRRCARWNLTNEHDSLDLDDMLDGIFNDKVGAAEKGHRVPEITVLESARRHSFGSYAAQLICLLFVLRNMWTRPSRNYSQVHESSQPSKKPWNFGILDPSPWDVIGISNSLGEW